MIEDDLRDVMRAHADEAPRATQVTIRAPSRRSSAWAVAAAVIVVLAVAGGIFAVRIAGRQHAASPAPLTCPDVAPADGAVPADPVGIDGHDRLTPDTTPARVLVCAYIDGRSLTGARDLTGDLGTVVDTTYRAPEGQPGMCFQHLLLTDDDAYLIGLEFEDGTEWISASFDHCAGSSNGEFDSPSNFGATAARAFATGSWADVVARDVGPGQCTSIGRYGQQESLVPDHPVSLLICPQEGDAQRFEAPAFDDLLAELQSSDARPMPEAAPCTQTHPSNPVGFGLRFDYAVGPSVTLSAVNQCSPGVTNGPLFADDADAVVRLVQQLLDTQ